MTAILKEIIRYPIKGFSGQRLPCAKLLVGQGVPFDRFLAFSNGQRNVAAGGAWTPCQAFVRLTKNSNLPRFGVTFDDVTGAVSVTHPGGSHIRFTVSNAASFEAANQTIASWFPGGPKHAPRLAEVASGQGYWDHDDAFISIINLTSVAQLSGLAGVIIDPHRFRSNLYISGCAAWSELNWLGRRLRIGEVEVEIIRPIDRCSAPSVNPDTGDIDLNIPAILARHTGHIYCGVYARVIRAGAVRLEDRIIDIGCSANIVKAASQRPTSPPVANWPRRAEIVDVVHESETVRSFWIRDQLQDEAVTPPLVPGQHVRLHGIGDDASQWRSYTLSGKNAAGDLRITVKRDPKGACSGWLHDHVVKGKSLLITGPFGSFVQHQSAVQPVIMLSAGIGITPLLAMLYGMHPNATVRFTHVCRNSRGLALWGEVEAIKLRMPNLSVHLYLDQHKAGDHLPDSGTPHPINWRHETTWASTQNAIAYMCGPKGFMVAARQQLRDADITNEDILEEIFASPVTTSQLMQAAPKPGAFSVHFAKSNLTVAWTQGSGSLLDLAESAGLMLPANCRGGACGTCAQTVQWGEVAYLLEPVNAAEGHKHLLCCAVPVSDVIIDA